MTPKLTNDVNFSNEPKKVVPHEKNTPILTVYRDESR